MYSTDKGINWYHTAKTPDEDLELVSIAFGSPYWISVARNCHSSCT